MNFTKIVRLLCLVFACSHVPFAAAQSKCQIPEQYLPESNYDFAFGIKQDQKIDWRSEMHLSKEVKTAKCGGQWFIFDRYGRMVEASFIPGDTARYTYQLDKKSNETKRICERGTLSNISVFNENGILVKIYRKEMKQPSYLANYDSKNRITYLFTDGHVDSVFYAKDGSCISKRYDVGFSDEGFNMKDLKYNGTAYFDKHGNMIKTISNDGHIETYKFTYTYHPNGRVKTCKNEEENSTESYDEYGHISIKGRTYDENGNILFDSDGKHIYENGVRKRIEVIENGKVVKSFKCDKYGNQLENQHGTLFELTYF